MSEKQETKFASWNTAVRLMDAVRQVAEAPRADTVIGTVSHENKNIHYLLTTSTLRVKKRSPQAGDTYCVYRILISHGPDHASGKICVLCTRPCRDPFFIETAPGVTYVVYKVSDDCDMCAEDDTYEFDDS